MIKIIDDTYEKKVWNEIADHPLQSWEWGEVRKQTGVEIIRIGIFTKDKLSEVYQMSIHCVPKSQFKIGYIPRSPLPKKELLKFLTDWGKKNNLIFVKFEPYVEHENARNLTMKQFSNLHYSPHQLFPDWTITTNLTPSEDDLLKSMKSKTRYNIRLAQKKGVEIREESNDKGFKIFSDLYFATTKRQRYFGHDKTYHALVWSHLKGSLAHILIAYYENKPLAAYELFLFKDRAYYPYGGSSTEQKNVMAPNLLMWEALKFAKKHGANYFDMWGAAPPETNKDDTYAGFTRFKEGYGGEYTRFVGSYDLIIMPFIYRMYNFLYRLRGFFLSLSFPR